MIFCKCSILFFNIKTFRKQFLCNFYNLLQPDVSAAVICKSTTAHPGAYFTLVRSQEYPLPAAFYYLHFQELFLTLQYYKKYFSNPNFSLKKSFKKALKTFLLPSFNLYANTP